VAVKNPLPMKMLGILFLSTLLTGCLTSSAAKQKDIQKRLPNARITADKTIIASGRVVGVADGDTLTVLAEDHTRYRIRLQGIDAPEKAQDFGQKCKESLMEKAINLHASVEVYKQDRYGRLVAKVTIESNDVALEQLRTGCAWYYTAYAKEQSPADQQTYAAAEKLARKTHTGLWKSKQPQAPWDYRHQKR
jgi:endonuclease YncB( thermonuclease family)